MDDLEMILTDLVGYKQQMQNTFLSHAKVWVDDWADGYTSIPVSLDVLDWKEIQKWYGEVLRDWEQHAGDGHNFNIFELLKQECGIYIQETMHSKLLKFLLDPRASHAQGNLFLQEFLKLLNVESPEAGSWQVSAEQGRLDLLIRRDHPETIFIIENKSNWACDQPNQLYRYWYRAIYLRTRKIDIPFYKDNINKYRLIYLAPNSAKQCESHSLCKPEKDEEGIYAGLPERVPMKLLTWTFNEQIQEWLENCKKRLPAENHRMREYISQYQMLCQIL